MECNECDFEIVTSNIREKCDEDYCFALCNGNILVKCCDTEFDTTCWSDIQKLKLKAEEVHFLGELRGKGCYAIELDENCKFDEDFKIVPLYDTGGVIDDELFSLAGMANQILFWEATHKHCGKCGGELINKENERAKLCKKCNLPIYPVICPAIIVAITKGDEILLAHNKTFKNNIYSIIAGFVDPGETLEDCVRREVYEEVGIKVKNIKYYGNQPWGFPNSLMIGFWAEYQSGEIKVDGQEIINAKWFVRGKYPNLPKKMSIARRMIDDFTAKRV